MDLVNLIGCKVLNFQDKYLGLLVFTSCSKLVAFCPFLDRKWKKLQGWKEKLLSKVGKEVLIKALAQAIPTYIISCSKLPIGCFNEIHSILAKFW